MCVGGVGGTMSLLKSCGQTPDTRASCRTAVVHGRRAPRQEWSMGGEHQDRSGPWEESTKTGVVHGRRAPRQVWSMGGEPQDRSGPWEESPKTGVVHGRRAPRQEWSMGGEHQDRSGPWEESPKTGVVHGRRAPRQEWSMGGEHQDSCTEGRRPQGPLHGFYCWFHNHMLDRWLGYGFKRGNGLFKEKNSHNALITDYSEKKILYKRIDN